ncbi:hypothetical protein [Flagellimonas zhangzhouensis]|uniref:Uncharacterized protein n=1 Tax=Flagellimonas zhangzhouensis TaxID=1073328 RepID=A0A1H2R6G9_9FLAO|nr:hypothetical protein [Allomuricauda zhangzhouensis]SDQ60224.1 hypothetical protein SAMN05216294_1856 [Allomuricauda zhangzhouensis]SDW15052.1 hypothetical protein SAMN04487892_0508 [Allomuricauda zhangzhouensis]
MVVKFIESTYDSVKDKLKNPFYGTLFIVWIIRNREFIFNIFFNEDINSDKRLEIIRQHFLNWDSFLKLIGTILISLGLMALIYISLNLSRFIVEFSERMARPWIQKLFSNTSIVSREDFVELEKERDYFYKKYSDERTEKTRLQRDLDQLLEQNLESGKSNDKQSGNVVSVSKTPKAIKDDPNNRIKLIVDKWKTIRPSYYTDFKKLLSFNQSEMKVIMVDSKMTDVGSIKEFKNKGLIEMINHTGSHYYNFTELGDNLAHYIKNHDDNKS